MDSVQFSCSVMTDSLQPHGLQQSRCACPSSTPGACSKSCPLSCWCHPTISFSVVPFSSCLQSFPPSGSFPVSQFFALGGQGIGASASAPVLPVNTQEYTFAKKKKKNHRKNGMHKTVSVNMWEMFINLINYWLKVTIVLHI